VGVDVHFGGYSAAVVVMVVAAATATAAASGGYTASVHIAHIPWVPVGAPYSLEGRILAAVSCSAFSSSSGRQAGRQTPICPSVPV